METKQQILNYYKLFRKDGNVNSNTIKEFTNSALYEQVCIETSFLNNTTLPEKLYCIVNNITYKQQCKECSKFVKFLNFRKGYNRYCSVKCSASSKTRIQKVKRTKLEKYGDENYNNQIKSRQTNLERYNNENYNNSEKAKKTNLERYGNTSFTRTKDYIEKSKNTCLKKYGTEHYSKTHQFKNQIKETCLERFGETSNLKTNENKQKQKDTCLKKYGAEFFKQSHLPNTTMNKLNNKEWLHNEHCNLKKTQLQIAIDLNVNAGTIFNYLKKYDIEANKHLYIPTDVHIKLNNKEWLHNEHCNLKKPQLQIAKELNVHTGTIYNYLKKHNIEAKIFFGSYAEKQLQDYIEKTYNTKVITNNRTIIKPYEIDIYLPEYNLAIEYNGIYWHRPEVYGSKLQWFLYHQNKEELCNSHGIQLLHLWENYEDHNNIIDDAICGNLFNDLEKVYLNLYKEK